MEIENATEEPFERVVSFVIPTDKWFKPNAISWNELAGKHRFFLGVVNLFIGLIGANDLPDEKKKRVESSDPTNQTTDEVDDEKNDESTTTNTNNRKKKPVFYLQTIHTNKLVPYYVIHIFLNGFADEFLKAIQMAIKDLISKAQEQKKNDRKKVVIEKKRKRDDNDITIDTPDQLSEILKDYIKIIKLETLNDLGLYFFFRGNYLDPLKIRRIFDSDVTQEILKSYGVDTNSLENFYSRVEVCDTIQSLGLEKTFERLNNLQLLDSEKRLPHHTESYFKLVNIFNKYKNVQIIPGELSSKIKSTDLMERLEVELSNAKRKYNDIPCLLENLYAPEYDDLIKTYNKCLTEDDLVNNYKQKILSSIPEKMDFLLNLIGPKTPEIVKSMFSISMHALFKWIRTNRCVDEKYHFFQRTLDDGTFQPYNFDRKIEGLSGASNFAIYMTTAINNIEYSCEENNNPFLMCYDTACFQFNNYTGEREYIWFQGVPASSKSFLISLLINLTVDELATERNDLGSDQSDISETLDNYAGYLYDEGYDPSNTSSKDKTVLNNFKMILTKNKKERKVLIVNNDNKSERYTLQYIVEKKFFIISCSNFQLKDKGLVSRFFILDIVPPKEKTKIAEYKIAKNMVSFLDPFLSHEFKSISKDLQALCCLTNLAITIHAQFPPSMETAEIVLIDITSRLAESNLLFEYEKRDTTRVLHYIHTKVIMNSWIEIMLLNGGSRKGMELNTETMLEAAKYQFSTIESTVLVFSTLFKVFQNKIMNAFRYCLTEKFFSLKDAIEQFYYNAYGVVYKYDPFSLNYTTHILALLSSKTNEFDIRTYKYNNVTYYDPNYCTITCKSIKAFCDKIEHLNEEEYIYTFTDYKKSLMKTTKRFKPKKVLKFIDKKSMDLMLIDYIKHGGSTALRINRILEDKGCSYPYKKDDIDEVVESLFLEDTNDFRECANGESFIDDTRIMYNDSKGLPVVVMDEYKKDHVKVSFLLEWLGRSDPEKVLLEVIEGLSKFVVSKQNVMVMLEKGHEIMELKPCDQKITRVVNGKTTTETKNTEKDGVWIKNYRRSRMVNDKYGFLETVHPSLKSIQKQAPILISSNNDLSNSGDVDDGDTLTHKYINELKNNDYIIHKKGIDRRYGELHLERYYVHGSEMEKYFQKK